jgi:predicted  nucleic acid-binding Zn-ribbon protein
MRQPLIDNTEEFIKIQERIDEVKKRISDLQEEKFGSDSEETEEKARQMFAQVGSAKDGIADSEELDELKSELKGLEEDRESLKEDLWEQMADIRFPLDGTIKTRDGEVVFPYSEEIEGDILDVLESVLAEDFNKNEVEIESTAITVDLESTDEAIEAVENRVAQLRDTAEQQYGAADHVKNLRERDSKVAGMMYTLRKVGEPLSKNELENEMNLDSGDLRGQLYHVVKKDPYLTKPDKEVELTTMGKMVIDEFVESVGTPTWDTPEDDGEEVDA